MENSKMKLISQTSAVFFFFLFLTFPPSLQTRREVITVKQGAVATDDGRCSHIGTKVLREGGHAVDALVASALCLGVVSPASSGIGGGAFLIVRSSNGTSQAIDSRETAPSLASQNMYAGNASMKSSGALSIAVPGELAGLHEAWKQYGRLPWQRLVRPAERLAEEGFRISPYLYIQMDKTRTGILSDKGLRSIFTSNGTLLPAGSICRNKKLANTLRTIRKHGPLPFYNGSIARNLVNDVQKAGGILTRRDFEQYRIKVKKPLFTEVWGYQILGMPPPSSGGAGMTLMFNILSQYGVPKTISDTLNLHRYIESLKHMFAVRMNIGDPDFVNISNVISDMLSIKFAKELKQTIFDNMTFSSNHYGGKWNQIQDHGTSHISIVDQDRNAVSMTTTINSYFGSTFLSPTTGMIFNNEMDDFSVPGNGSSPANFISAKKRPLSSMTPTIVLKNGKLKAVIGASGGAMIIAGTAQVLLNNLAGVMDPLSSILAPRTYHQLIPNVVLYENWTSVTGDHFEIPAKTRRALQEKGHVLQSLSGGTICQLIVLNGNNLTAVSDPRKGGFPSGY
ncbi:Gamma-glutamyltranspeptidase 1 [Ranunculus cassubicifolius]